MAYINKLFDENFLEYASYVIKERAIPHLDDGLKPVQRRILQSLHDVDDGKFHKVANVVGHAMQYHPHGDASIYEALVNLANKELFIDKQGNFGNTLTGDPASAARYIECRLLPMGKEVLFGPEITDFTDSYDGRRKEPITLPAKIPLPLILGAEGIAVGMSSKMLPHNFVEVLEAEQAHLRGEEFELFPDVSSGGIIDVSNYNNGNGKILSRAKLDSSDPKRIVVRELPYGVTTESLIASVEAAARSNKIKIGAINDYTTENVEIEIKLSRGVHTEDVLDGLFAFTDCEVSVSLNMLMIRDEKPVVMSVPEVIEHHAGRLLSLLEKELLLEKSQLLDKIHARTLEKIFIVEKIYKRIEPIKTVPGIFRTVHKGFIPFAEEIAREITDDDVERLLKIPIRRISQFDIERMEDEIKQLQDRIDVIDHHLAHLVEYALSFLEGILEKYRGKYPRHSEIVSLRKVDVRDAAQKNLKVKYNPDTGYLGYEASGGRVLFDASVYDRVLYIKKDASYLITDVPDKLFVGKGMLYAGLADKETCEEVVFSLVYRNNENNYPYIKRCRIIQYIMNRSYSLVPEEGVLVRLTIKEDVAAVVDFKQKSLIPGSDQFPVSDYLIKGVKARGVRIKPKEFTSARFTSLKTLEKKDEL
ncbi:MAG: DNA topoisomerase IV subunit A [Spirochaetaceae bacterium]|nr:DNA topoisomerase IV subunit A [Spirochaetaceae bacterium]